MPSFAPDSCLLSTASGERAHNKKDIDELGRAGSRQPALHTRVSHVCTVNIWELLSFTSEYFVLLSMLGI